MLSILVTREYIRKDTYAAEEQSDEWSRSRGAHWGEGRVRTRAVALVGREVAVRTRAAALRAVPQAQLRAAAVSARARVGGRQRRSLPLRRPDLRRHCFLYTHR